jgi:hypothetical protein
MQEFSKYKMITAGIILMFIFAVAAIYSNTKEAAEKKLNEKPAIEQSQGEIEQGTAINTTGDFATQNTNNDNNIETDNQILQITERLDELEKKVFTQENNENLGMRCNIKGIVDDGHFVPMSSDDAVKESRSNGKEVLITCIFK